MIDDERLGAKHIFQPEIAIKMIQLISGFKAFDSAILKTIVGVQGIPNRSMKSHFLPLRRCANESRSDWKQEIHGVSIVQIQESLAFNRL